MTDIHNRNQRQKTDLEKLESHPDLSQRNKNQIKQFIDQIKAEGSSKDRIHNYMWSFHVLAPSIDFQLDKPSKQDLIKLVGKINNNELTVKERKEKNGSIKWISEDKDYSAHSRAEFRKTLSKFYRAYLDKEDVIDFINVSVKKKEREGPKPEELPKPRHIKALAQSCRNPRDEALILALWDTGARIEATLNLKWKNFKPGEDQSYMRYTERNKTMLRKIPVAESVPSLKQWRGQHPDPSPEAYIFTKYEGNKATKKPGKTPMNYGSAYKMLKRRRKDVPKKEIPSTVKTNPHAFRKARATFLASTGMNVNLLARFMGWSDITTAQKYVGLAQNKLDNAFKQAVGLDEGETDGLDMDREELKPGKCPSCAMIVSNVWHSCPNCSTTLEEDGLLALLEESNETKIDPELSVKVGMSLSKNPDKTFNEIKQEVMEKNGN